MENRLKFQNSSLFFFPFLPLPTPSIQINKEKRKREKLIRNGQIVGYRIRGSGQERTFANEFKSRRLGQDQQPQGRGCMATHPKSRGWVGRGGCWGCCLLQRITRWQHSLRRLPMSLQRHPHQGINSIWNQHPRKQWHWVTNAPVRQDMPLSLSSHLSCRIMSK